MQQSTYSRQLSAGTRQTDLALMRTEAFNRELLLPMRIFRSTARLWTNFLHDQSVFDFTPGGYQKMGRASYYSHALDARYQAQYRRSLDWII